MPPARVLIIAGSDPSGGAGIQGDIKTVTCLGAYAAAAITALTAQNTLGVFGIHPVPPAFVAEQARLVLDDIGADAIKTGMLHSAGITLALAELLGRYAHIPLVIDPVMVAKGGAPLLAPDAVDTLVRRLFPLAALVTPNIPEAELLAGMAIRDADDMREAGRRILALGPQAVLVKGGHLAAHSDDGMHDNPPVGGERLAAPPLRIENILLFGNPQEAETINFSTPRMHSRHTHGTGCALASAIATGIAQGMVLPDAITRAQEFVAAAIAAAPGLGAGHGPMGYNKLFCRKRQELPPGEI